MLVFYRVFTFEFTLTVLVFSNTVIVKVEPP